MANNLVPMDGHDNQQDLGTALKRWRRLYLGTGLHNGAAEIAFADLLRAAGNARVHQFAGGAAPTVTDDSGDGYGIGSLWFYGSRIFICSSATVGAAVWYECPPLGGGGGGGPAPLVVTAGGFTVPTANAAPLDVVVGSHVTRYVQRLAVNGELWFTHRLPSTVAAAGNVTVTVTGFSAIAAAAKNIRLQLSASVAATGATWDVSYANRDSGDVATASTQGHITTVTWVNSLAELGVAAGDNVQFKLTRVAAAANELSGSWLLLDLELIFP